MPTNLDNMLAPLASSAAKARGDADRLARHRRAALAKLEAASQTMIDFTYEGHRYRLHAHSRDRHVSLVEGPFPDGSAFGVSDAAALAIFDWLLAE